MPRRERLFASRTNVLLVLPSDVVDRAREMAGKATATIKMPVSLQIVLRGLIEEGLDRGDAAALLENFERQARIVRDIRRSARARVRRGAEPAGTRR
jgi:hypothetical protein